MNTKQNTKYKCYALFWLGGGGVMLLVDIAMCSSMHIFDIFCNKSAWYQHTSTQKRRSGGAKMQISKVANW